MREVHPEHILLALAEYNCGPAIEVLKICGVNLASCMADMPQPPSQPPRPQELIRLPLDAQAMHLLAYGKEEGKLIGLEYLGTEHLLLGLLRLDDSRAKDFLDQRGITIEAVRAALRDLDDMKDNSGSA